MSLLDKLVNIFYIAGSIEKSGEVLDPEYGLKPGFAWFLATLSGMLSAIVIIPLIKKIFVISAILGGSITYYAVCRRYTDSRINEIHNSQNKRMSITKARSLLFPIFLCWFLAMLTMIFILTVVS